MAVDVASSLTSALGLSSGINTTQLVSDLTSATFQPKLDNANARLTTANARISALASAKSSLQTFSDALTNLLKSSEYSGQPVSNDPTIAAVSLIPGADTPTGLPAQLEVQQLAQSQVLQSATLTAATATAGVGTLNLVVGGVSTAITLTDPKTTLNDLKDAINAKATGVTASIVTDNSGARLVLKGETGAAKAFTLTAGGDADTDLQRFTWDGATGGMSRSQTAANAKIRIDNVDMEFATNEVTTAIPFVRIDLNRAVPGTTVTLATDQPTSSMADLVGEFVSAYNNLKTALNTSMGAGSTGTTVGLLSGDSGIREMSRRLAGLVSAKLTDTGEFQSLSDLGVRTERNGTLTLNSATLNAALAKNPQAVTQMLNPTVPSAGNPGIAGALKDINTALNANDGPLASSKAIYDKLQTSLQKQLDKVGEDRTNYSSRLTRTYSAMQTQLLKFKATQSYLEQQISVWNNSGSN